MVGIGAQRKVLIVTGSDRDAKYLNAIVRRIGLDPTTVVAGNGGWNGNPKGYDLVVLNNVARSRIAPAVQNALVAVCRRWRLAGDGWRRPKLRPRRMAGQSARACDAGGHEAAAAP